MHRFAAAGLVALVVGAALPAHATPRTTVTRTIRDLDDDNLLEYAPGEDYTVLGAPEDFGPPHDGSIINFLQLSDFQMVDEESPGRVEFLDGTQRGSLFTPFAAAYRPQESLTTQVTEAMVRSARNTTSPVTGELLDLAILTGDNADSQQFNEIRWFIDILDGTAGRRDVGALPTQAERSELGEGFPLPEDFELPDKIDPNSGIEGTCEPPDGSLYDGVRGGGQPIVPDLGFYEPDASGPNSDGDGYSPERTENAQSVGRDVTVRDFPGLLEAAQHPFEAIGLDLPWYSAFGNHDALVQGNSPDAYAGPVGTSGETSNATYQNIVTGCAKPNALTSIFGTAPVPPEIPDPPDPENPSTTQLMVPRDDRRCFLAKDEPVGVPGVTAPPPCDFGGFIQHHFVTTGSPIGHGFAAAPCEPESDPDTIIDPRCQGYGRPPVADLNNDGYYSFTPTPGLRFIVLDTVTDECGSLFCSEGSVDHPQFVWLEDQIEQADAIDEYVMVFSHHTLRTTRWPSTDLSEHPMHYGQRIDPRNPANPQNETGGDTLAELYCRSPNVIAHIAGHEHGNYVQHYRCMGEDGSPPGGPSAVVGGFWHISTAAHIDYPQQSRMIELIDNGDGKTMSLVLTIIDHDGPPNPGGPKPDLVANGQSGEQVLKLASIGRELAYNDYQACGGIPLTCEREAGGGPNDRNVIIVLKRPWLGPPAERSDH